MARLRAGVSKVKASMRKDEIIKAISLPIWKQEFVRKNRILYKANKDFIDEWLEKMGSFALDDNGDRKFQLVGTKYEWQSSVQIAGQTGRIYSNSGSSGIRVKRGNYFPALVAMAQIPVVGGYAGTLRRKNARIQSFDVDVVYGEPFKLGG